MQTENRRRQETDVESRSTNPLVYALEEMDGASTRGVPYERAIQVARTDLALGRAAAAEWIEGLIDDGKLERVSADRLRTP